MRNATVKTGPVWINTTVEPDFATEVRRAARREDRSVSSFVRVSLEEALERRGRSTDPEQEYGRGQDLGRAT